MFRSDMPCGADSVGFRLGALRAIPLKLAIAQRVIPGLLAQGRCLYLDVSVPARPVAGTTINSQPEP